MNLSPHGVWTNYPTIGRENAAEAARLVQDLGFGAFWLGNSPEPADLRPLLEATDTLVVATGIVNMWVTEPSVVAEQAAGLERDFPDRTLIGIGAGHPEANSDYRHPRRAMIRYLDALDAAPEPLPAERRVLAALGPKMLELCSERALGTHPYFTVVEHTAWAREQLGSGPLVAVELACVVETDTERARAAAREYAGFYLKLSNYTGALERFGFDADDFADGGSDKLIDAVIPHGSAEQIAEVVHAHLEAGADHVCLQPVGGSGVPREAWTALAGALGS
jgi:probable F420-dependent oxidoreductase